MKTWNCLDSRSEICLADALLLFDMHNFAAKALLKCLEFGGNGILQTGLNRQGAGIVVPVYLGRC